MLLNENVRGLRVIRNDIPEMLAAMNNSAIEFHLTGSRGWPNQFVAGVHLNTDWDFFVKSSDEVYDFLLQNDFYQEFENPYEDSPNSASVWRYEPFVLGLPSIHVQIVHDINLKISLENMAKQYLPMTFYRLTKDQRKVMWRLLYATYELGHKSAMPAVNVPEIDDNFPL